VLPFVKNIVKHVTVRNTPFLVPLTTSQTTSEWIADDASSVSKKSLHWTNFCFGDHEYFKAEQSYQWITHFVNFIKIRTK